MKNQALDNLFKNKLAELRKEPPANTWERIQANTKKERFPWIYIRIAAAVVILAVFAGIIWIFTSNQPAVKIIAIHGTPVDERAEKQSNEHKQQVVDENKAIEGLAQANKPEQKTTEKPQAESGPPKKQNPVTAQNKLTIDKTANKKSEQLAKSTETESNQPETYNQQPATRTQKGESSYQQQETRKRGTRAVTFNIEEFTAARIPETTNVPANDVEKKTTWKKVVDFAKNIKDGKETIGEIREAKNELFALNFKNKNENSNQNNNK